MGCSVLGAGGELWLGDRIPAWRQDGLRSYLERRSLISPFPDDRNWYLRLTAPIDECSLRRVLGGSVGAGAEVVECGVETAAEAPGVRGHGGEEDARAGERGDDAADGRWDVVEDSRVGRMVPV